MPHMYLHLSPLAIPIECHTINVRWVHHQVTPKQAVRHARWQAGNPISIRSIMPVTIIKR